MARALTLGAVAVVALGILGNCTGGDDHDATSTAAAPSSSAAATSNRSAQPTEEVATSAPTTSSAAPAPPPLNVVPLTYVADVADQPAVPALPPLPAPGTTGAAVEVRGGWAGSFALDGNDPRIDMRCATGSRPRSGIDVYSLNYSATSRAGASDYSLPDGGWSLGVTRIGALGHPAGTSVNVTAVDADGVAWEIPGFGTEAEPDILTAGSADNSAIAFAYVAAVRPQRLGSGVGSERITWITVTGTVSCPAQLPDLTWGDG